MSGCLVLAHIYTWSRAQSSPVSGEGEKREVTGEGGGVGGVGGGGCGRVKFRNVTTNDYRGTPKRT